MYVCMYECVYVCVCAIIYVCTVGFDLLLLTKDSI